MDVVEAVAVRAFLRKHHKAFGFVRHADTISEIESVLKRANSTNNRKQLEDYMDNQIISLTALVTISEASLSVIGARRELLNNILREVSPGVAGLISSLLGQPIVSATHIIDAIAANWKQPCRTGRDAFQTGVYQVYRRYKPTRAEVDDDVSAQNPNMHSVICELVYADSNDMECIWLTAHYNLYQGTLSVDNNDILSGLFQRQRRDNVGFHQRYASTRLERTTLNFYSGLLVKIGDTERRPLSSELIYVLIPPRQHYSLYKFMIELYRNRSWRTKSVSSRSIAEDYMTAIPPARPRRPDDGVWSRVKLVKDFPALAYMAQPVHGQIRLREPSRTLAPDIIGVVSKHKTLGVFQHSRWQPRTDIEE